jgi:hypothetical protein
MGNDMDLTPGTFQSTGRELGERIKKPLNRVAYWGYMITGVVFFGGLGVLYNYYDMLGKVPTCEDWRAAALALATYAPAVAGAAAVQVILDQEESQEFKALAVFGVIVVVLFCLPVLGEKFDVLGSNIAGGIATVLSWLMCWIASANDDRFNPSPNASMGGDLPPSGAAGSTPTAPPVAFKL